MKTTKYILILLALTALSMDAWAQQGLQGSGSDTEPYLIQSADDWNTFAQSVTNGTNYSGQFVKLDADITVTTMAGTRSSDSNYHAFSGTFDGDGHTLTLDYSTTLSDGAPFRVVNGATLNDLHIAGTIQTSGQFNGVVGHAYGTNSLTNCRSSITINSTREGDGTHGGFVGVIGSGTTTFTGCAFNGTFTSTNTKRWGGFVGFVEGNNQAHANFTDCMFAPANNSFGFSTEESQTFARLRGNNSNYATFNNCYYTKQLGGIQGKQAFSITGIKSAIVAFNGNATTYGVSSIYAYSVGMKYVGTCYAGNGETVSLDLTHDNHPGITYGNGYIASPVNLNGTGNPYTLTMPNEDVTIAPNITAATVSVQANPNIYGAVRVSLDNTNWSSSVSAAVDAEVYIKINAPVGYTYSYISIEAEYGDPFISYNTHFTMPASNVTVTVGFNQQYFASSYTVTLSPGVAGGTPLICNSTVLPVAPDAASAENLQFYHADNNTMGFRLDNDYYPNSFTSPYEGAFLGWEGWSNNGYITLTSMATTFTAQWFYHIVTLSPGVGGGEPIVYTFNPENAAPNAATADTCQFYYVNDNTIGFRLPYEYCPNSFTAPNGLGFSGWSNNGYITLTSTETTFTAQWNAYIVTLSPGMGEGDPIVYTFNPETAASNAATAENLQFYYVNYNTPGFRLPEDYCPNSFTVPNGVYFIGWDGWSNNGYITLTSTETTFTAQWGNPTPPLSPGTYIDGNGEYHTCTNYTVLTGGEENTTLAAGWYVVDNNITYSNDNDHALTLDGDVTLILCNGKTMTVTAEGSGIMGNLHSLTIYGQSLDPNVAGTLNVYIDSYVAIDWLSTYTQHSGKVIVSSPYDDAIFTQSFTLNGGSLEASGKNNGIHATYNLTINGGTVTATSTQTNGGYAGLTGGNVVINGGKVETNKIFSNSNITLGYTHPDDYIKSDIFYYAYSGNGTVSVKSGQTFYYINGVENVTVSGTIANPKCTIAGKRLRPYFEPISVTKTIAGYGTGNGGWHLIASPIIGNTYVEYVGGLVSNTASHYDLYRFNQEANKEWENYKANSPTNHPDFITLRNGRGYLYAHSTDTTLTFSGTPYTGNGVVNLTYSEVNPDENMHGWNLVGNPFGTAATLGTTPFYRMNAAGTEIIVSETNTVDAMEGIFVKATAPNQSVTFTQATRANTSQKGDDRGFIVLDLGHGGAVIDRAIVRLGEGQTLPKFQIRDNSTKIYIPQDGEDYAVVNVGTDVARNVSTEIPVNFKAEENGTYTLTFSSENVDFSYLHLIDNLTGADVDLLTPNEGDAINRVSTYTFTAKTTDYESRFKLVFFADEAVCKPGEAFAFINNGNIIVNGEGTLQVMDVMGRVVVSVGGHTRCVPTAGMPAGVYVLRLINGNNVRTQKIVIP